MVDKETSQSEKAHDGRNVGSTLLRSVCLTSDIVQGSVLRPLLNNNDLCTLLRLHSFLNNNIVLIFYASETWKVWFGYRRR